MHNYKTPPLTAIITAQVTIRKRPAGTFFCLISTGLSMGAQPQAANPGAPALVEEEEVIVQRQRDASNFSEITQGAKQLVDTAGSLGDPLAGVFSLPGVIYSKGGNRPAVRGSSPRDNQYRVDSLPVSYVFHDFGVSVFSEFILEDFDLYSAAFGPEFGSVTGAVFDIKLRQPRQQALQTNLDFSMLRSGVFLESGLWRDTAFYFSARRSLIDQFVDEEKVAKKGVQVQKMPVDSDYQFKFNWSPANATDTVTVAASGAANDAAANFTSTSDFAQKNPDFAGEASLAHAYDGQSVTWQRQSENGIHSTLILGHSEDARNLNWGKNYVNYVALDQQLLSYAIHLPVLKNVSLSAGTQWQENKVHYVFDAVLFACTEVDPNCASARTGAITANKKIEYQSQHGYIDAQAQLTRAFSVELGLQVQENSYNHEQFLNPRGAAQLQINDKMSLHAKAGRYNRFPDLNTALPEVGNPDIASPTSNHYTVGSHIKLSEHWSVELESYYKTFNKLPRAFAGTDDDDAPHYLAEIAGRAYGLDLLINKSLNEAWYSWLSLSLGRSVRTDKRLQQTRNYTLDTPFISNWVVGYHMNSKVDIGWRWSLRSGQAYTPIIGVRENPDFENSILPEYGEPFSARLPYYRRLDFRIKWVLPSSRRLDHALTLDIINALNERNVQNRSLDYGKVKSTDDKVQTKDSVSYGIIPALSYRITF